MSKVKWPSPLPGLQASSLPLSDEAAQRSHGAPGLWGLLPMRRPVGSRSWGSAHKDHARARRREGGPRGQRDCSQQGDQPQQE